MPKQGEVSEAEGRQRYRTTHTKRRLVFCAAQSNSEWRAVARKPNASARLRPAAALRQKVGRVQSIGARVVVNFVENHMPCPPPRRQQQRCSPTNTRAGHPPILHRQLFSIYAHAARQGRPSRPPPRYRRIATLASPTVCCRQRRQSRRPCPRR